MREKLTKELGAREYQLDIAIERLKAAEKRIETLKARVAEINLALKPTGQQEIPLKSK